MKEQILHSPNDRIFEIFERLKEAGAFSRYFIQPGINNIVVQSEVGKVQGHYAYYNHKEYSIGAFFIPDFSFFNSKIHEAIILNKCYEALEEYYGKPTSVNPNRSRVYKINTKKFREKYGDICDVEGKILTIKSIVLEVLV